MLLTGGSEGMGLSVARQLSAKGANVVIVSRSVEKLEAALKEVKVRPFIPLPLPALALLTPMCIQAAARNPSTQRFLYISADVAAPSYADKVVAQVKEWNGGQPPDIVWCVAGMAFPELFTDMDMASMRRHMDVNYFGTAEMAHATLREWFAPDQKPAQPRHLIMTSSVVVFFALPGYLPYLPSKFALRGLAEGLERESMLYPEQKVDVHLVCPGTILSPGYDREEVNKPDVTRMLEANDPRETPDQVAAKSIRALERGHFLVTVNWLGWLMRVGSQGSARRNGAGILDSLATCLLAFLVWPIAKFFIHGDIRGFAKSKGHPWLYKKD